MAPLADTSAIPRLRAAWRWRACRSPIPGSPTRRIGSHVIEPIGQVIARQASIDQNALPDEDSKSLVFDDANLFDWNKFSGYDRIETGTRANVGLQYTFQASYGGYARLLAGESYQLAGANAYANPGIGPDGNPVFTPYSGLQTSRSDYVLGAYMSPISYAAAHLAEPLRPEHARSAARGCGHPSLARTGVGIGRLCLPQHRSDQRHLHSPSRTSPATSGSRSPTAGASRRPLRYDIDADQLASDMFQARYADECFVLTATYTDNLYHNPDIVDGQTLMVRFELKHLGQFGYATNSLDYRTSQQGGG